MGQPKAIFFDLDGTLMDSGAAVADGVAHACQQVALAEPALSVDRILSDNREAFRAYWPEVEDKWTLGFLDGVAVSKEAWRRTLRSCGCDDEALLSLALEAQSHQTRASYRLFEDAQEVLGFLKTRFALAIITNGAADTQREKLRVTSLEKEFTATAISGELGIAKPDAAIFRFALKSLGLSRQDAWHVGDSLSLDVRGAKAAGITSVWLNRTGKVRDPDTPRPDLEIASLMELPERLFEAKL
jgi:HAD superfamily hydrolase (TIGR01549 family)